MVIIDMFTESWLKPNWAKLETSTVLFKMVQFVTMLVIVQVEASLTKRSFGN